MSARDEKISELIELLGFDTGLAEAVRDAHADTPIEEIQKIVDEARSLRARVNHLAKMFGVTPLDP